MTIRKLFIPLIILFLSVIILQWGFDNVVMMIIALSTSIVLIYIASDHKKVDEGLEETDQWKNIQRMLEEKKIKGRQIKINKVLEENAKHRDADVQDEPYIYKLGQHANEALAIRYGIANPEPSSEIEVKKIKKLEDHKYIVQLVKHRNREAVVIIEKGTEYIKTFYPLNESWFEEQRELELTLKGNGSFTLKELAKFHVQRILSLSS